MIGYYLTISVILAGLIAALLSPLWAPILERHDAKNRLLDRLEEEWDREADELPPSRTGWGGW